MLPFMMATAVDEERMVLVLHVAEGEIVEVMAVCLVSTVNNDGE
jgi:hypothetical protein